MKNFTIEFTADGMEIKKINIKCFEYELKNIMYSIAEGLLKQIKYRGKNELKDFYNMDYNGIIIGLETTKGMGYVKTFIEY